MDIMKKVDPCLEVMALAQNVQQIPTGAVDYSGKLQRAQIDNNA